MKERTYWEKLKKTGWLEHVPKGQRAELRARIKNDFKTDPEWAHLSLSQTGFDSECIDEPGSYCRVLKLLAEDSQQVFHPTHIKEHDVELSKRRYAIQVSFRHNGKSFSVTVPHDSNWFEMAVLDLINQALEAGGAKERFIILPSDDQLVFLAFVPIEVYDKAVADNLIPKDTWQEPEEC